MGDHLVSGTGASGGRWKICHYTQLKGERTANGDEPSQHSLGNRVKVRGTQFLEHETGLSVAAMGYVHVPTWHGLLHNEPDYIDSSGEDM